jgi:sugar lactone lactonase YvrE
MNDGACDPEGRFWAGSMAYDATPGAGSLFRVDRDGTLTTVLEGVTVSNGLAWDPDGRSLYYIDSATGGVDRFTYDRATGDVAGRRRMIEVPRELGEPDGMTVDADGCLWIALWNGGQVRRYDPGGRLLESVEVPVARPTSCAFGGRALDRLFVTTSRFGLDPGALSEQPLAGALLVVDPGVRGLVTPPFAG